MRVFVKSSIALVLSISGWTPPLNAQTPDRDVIVVQSSPVSIQSNEVAGAVVVLSRRDIEEHPLSSLADTLSSQPGVSTSFFGPASNRPIIRGLGAERVRVLSNGVGLLDVSSASPDHALSSEALEAEQIEVFRGPSAIAYGGGAIGGVVNVIDQRIPTQRVDGAIENRIYAGVSTVDRGNTAAGRSRFNIGEVFVINLEALTRRASDYDIPVNALSAELIDRLSDADLSVLSSTNRVQNTALDFNIGSLGGAWIGEDGYIGLSWKSTQALYGVISAASYTPNGSDDLTRIDLRQDRIDLRGQWSVGRFGVDHVNLTVGHADYEHVELEGEEVGTVFGNLGYEARAEVRFRPATWAGGRWEGTAGVQVLDREFSAFGTEAFVPSSTTQDVGAFFVQRWDNGIFGAEAGMRLETRDLSTVQETIRHEAQSTSLAVFARPAPQTFFAITVSQSERAPTDVELFADGPHIATQAYEIGDRTLSTERATSLELTLRAQRGRWDVETAAFVARFDGFIGAFPTGETLEGLPVFRFEQQDVDMIGGEVSLRGDLFTFQDWDLSSELQGEWVDAQLGNAGYVPQMPPLSVTARLNAQRARHEWSMEAIFANRQSNVADFERPTPGYSMFNLRYVGTPFDQRDFRIILEARNLANVEARLHTSLLKDVAPLPGRNLRAAIVLEF